MKVLVTGGYGFIGSHVVERFYKEGHQVFIIDNLSTGNTRNVNCRHKFYNLDVEDINCDELFKSNRFDIVIHLAAQINVTTSMEHPYSDTKSNLLGLTNMLELSAKYGIKKFIFASSAAVYGDSSDLPLTEDSACNPLSPYGMSKLTGELYCKKWWEIYGLNTLCFRFSNVYGPRQGTIGEGGVVSIFLEKALKGHEITVYGDGNQTRDFIYVEDIADAIYKSIKSRFSGILNLSTNTENSVNQLISILNGIHPIKHVEYMEPRKGDILKSYMDNTKVKGKLNWKPKYSFEEGINKTFDWYSTYIKADKALDKPKETRKGFIGFLKPALPYLENFLAFAMVLLLNLSSNASSEYKMLDYSLIYIIIIGIMYGTRQVTISVLLACTSYFITSLDKGRDMVSLIFDINSILQMSFYILVGLAIGYTVDKKDRELVSKKNQLKASEEKREFLNKIYNETILVNEELQNQIIGNENSYGKIYSITKVLDSLEPENVYSAAVKVLENITGSNAVCIYIPKRNNRFVRLVSSSKSLGQDIPKSLSIEEAPGFKNVIEKKEIFFNYKLSSNLPALIAPISNERRVIAVITVNNIAFEKMTLYFQNLFTMAIGLITSSLSRAYKYENATHKEKTILGTYILHSEAFENVLRSKITAKRDNGIDFTLLRIKNTNGYYSTKIEELSSRLKTVIRDIDYIGIHRDKNIYILLSNTLSSEAVFVEKRLEEIGILTEIAGEKIENSYYNDLHSA